MTPRDILDAALLLATIVGIIVLCELAGLVL